MIHQILIPISDADRVEGCLPTDRTALIELAKLAPATATEVHVVVVLNVLDDEPPFELARIELARNRDGWRIQYLPFPWPSEVFAGVTSDEDDIYGYLAAVSEGEVPMPFRIHSSESMHREGLGPRARIDTRRYNTFPVLERDADVQFVCRKLNSAHLSLAKK